MFDHSDLVWFFWNRYRRETVLVVAGSVVGVIFQTAALQTIVAAAGQDWADSSSLWRLIDVVIFIKLSAIAKAAALILAVRTGERACADVAIDLAQRISGSELADLEQIGRGDLLTRLSADLRSLSGAVWVLIPVLLSLMLIAVCTAFMLFAAPEATLLLIAFIIAGTTIVRRIARRFGVVVDAAVSAEDRFFDRVDDLFHGFKELKTAAEKGADFTATALHPAARHARRLRRISGYQLARQTLVLDVLLYGSLGIVAFVLPQVAAHSGLVILIGTLAYLVDRIDFLDLDLPLILQGDAALGRILALQNRLPAAVATDTAPELTEFREIALNHVTFRYRGSAGDGWFGLGPIDLRLNAPEICLIAGGNGSGKSTLLKLLCGLYQPEDGTIEVDGRRVPIEAYRSLFSVVFTDFHLFPTLHGLAEDPETVTRLLELLGLSGSVRVENGRFSTLALSTGQRKRLALVAAWLEGRPIMVFDEWTADQDPEFRQVFFARLLPELKALGRTVIAVTHDDRYFHYGDRLIRMDGGLITAERATESHG
ncbi:MAG: cyclic peptide export ABC transporter [Azospirillum sp.]|nr:cyclic peptide export ABC transporter [Azospirillum sp.]